MTNHVHLLMTPKDEIGISRVMQHLGRMYVLYINRTYRRTGTLWPFLRILALTAFVSPFTSGGRHKASLVNAEEYLLTCYRYIEMNPVAAGMVATPEQYRWGTYRWHAWGRQKCISF